MGTGHPVPGVRGSCDLPVLGALTGLCPLLLLLFAFPFSFLPVPRRQHMAVVRRRESSILAQLNEDPQGPKQVMERC